MSATISLEWTLVSGDADPSAEPSVDSPTDRSHDPTSPAGFQAAALACGPALWRVAARMVDVDSAEDLVQEALARAFAQRGSYRGEGRAFSWLCGVLLNVCRGELRWRRVRGLLGLGRAVEPGGGAERAERSLAPGPGPGELLERRERAAALHAAITRLPHKQRAALVLVSLEGVSVPEAARALSTSEQAVWQALSRGRARLREVLGEL